MSLSLVHTLFENHQTWAMMKKKLGYIIERRVLGAIFLVVGTCLGGGILALPISSSPVGFSQSTGFLLLCWIAATYCAFILLQINCCFSPGTNLLTMAKETLGPFGRIVTGITYLALLYTLLSAYISGGSEIVSAILGLFGFVSSANQSAFVFAAIFGMIVFSGMRRLDYINRLFIVLKIAIYGFILFLSSGQISLPNLIQVPGYMSSGMLMVFFTAFGFAVIIPSIRVYLENDIEKTKMAIWVGSLIPILVYVCWNFAIMGVLGVDTLSRLNTVQNPNERLITLMTLHLNNPFLSIGFYIFASLCLVTSFFGIALSLSDFLADSFALQKKGIEKAKLFVMTFAPPLLVVLYFTQGFVFVLSFAGIFCVLLHILIPIWMGYRMNKQLDESPIFLPLWCVLPVLLLSGYALFDELGLLFWQLGLLI
jgi:tyrosine-specific transport protein